MGRSRGRQHCSSLCSQSEGHGYGAKSGANSLIYKIVNDRPCLPAQHSSPSLCKQSELQCCASCLASLPILFFLDFKHPTPRLHKKPTLPIQIFAGTKRQNENLKRSPETKTEANKALQRTKKAPRPTSRGAFFIEILHCFPVSVAGRQECGD